MVSKFATNLKVKKRTTATIGTQWAVLSVLLLWLSGLASSQLTYHKSVPTIVLICILLASHLFALCLPGLILVRTQFKYETIRTITVCAIAPAAILTILRLMEMFMGRIDCNKNCANSIPYYLELFISFSLPFILVFAMYLIARLALPKRLNA